MSTPIRPDTGLSPDDEITLRDIESRLHARQLPKASRYLLPLLGAVVVVILAVLGTQIALAVFLGWLVFGVVTLIASGTVEGSRRAKDRLATLLVSSAFVIALLPLVGLLYEVVSNGASQVSGTFLTSSMRNVLGAGGGINHAIIGTLLVTAMTAIMSVPIGLLTAIYLVEFHDGKISYVITFLVDVMTGIPSIVAGLFAYALFEIFFGPGVQMGFGGAVALSVLMIPLVVRSAEEMLKLVPRDLREAAYALGVPKWRVILKVVLPTALPGIITGSTIAVARIIGETAPLLIICGFTTSTNDNLFGHQMTTLPVFIYESFKNPGYPPQYSLDRAWGAAFVLTVIIMVLSLAARIMSRLFAAKSRG
jgi:phosphate transport system permease protein